MWKNSPRSKLPKKGPEYFVNGRRISYGPDWYDIANRTRKRDNYTCQVCGKRRKGSLRKKALHVHHITPLRAFGGDYEAANHPDNLVTLCKSCHKKVESGSTPLQLALPLLATPR